MEIRVEDQIVMKKINEIKPYVRNPRKNDKTVDLLVKIIPIVGFNVPILIDEKGIIVKGHARYTAAIRLDMKEVPCIITHADEEAIKADRITDNKISEFSEWMDEDVLHELDMIDIDFDFTELGFPQLNFDDIPTDNFEEYSQSSEYADNYEEYDGENGQSELSAEDKQARYEAFLREQEKANEKKVSMTTEAAIERAEQKQTEVTGPKTNYLKCVCEKCGHVFFVDADEKWNPEDGNARGSYFKG